MGIGGLLGNIGSVLAAKKPLNATTPPFLPPVGPTPGILPPPPTTVPPPPPQGESPTGAPDPDSTDTPPDAPPAGGPAAQMGQINPQFQGAANAVQQRLSQPPMPPNTYQGANGQPTADKGQAGLDADGNPIMAPGSQKIGLGRKIGGLMLAGIGGHSPIGAAMQTLGSRIAYGQYPEQMARYQADLQNAQVAETAANAAQDRATKLANEKRLEAKNASDLKEAESRIKSAADARGDALKQREEEAAAKMVQAGATPYTPPPSVSAPVPPPDGIPGLAPTTATVPSPPPPSNVITMAGQQWNIPQKPVNTLEERATQILSDPTLTPQAKKQKLDETAQAFKMLHPSAPIHGFETDAAGNVTLVTADPANPTNVQKIPVGPIGKPEKPTADAGAIAGLDREVKQFGTPYQKMSESVGTQLDKILDAEKMVAGGAVQQALGVPKVLTALVSGQGSGVRITQAELNMIAHARGIGGDIEGFFKKISGQGQLTATQQQQLNDILSDVRARILQKKQVADAALDEINGAGTREQIVSADKKYRKMLGDAETGGATPPASQQNAQSGQPNEFGYIVGRTYSGLKYLGGDPKQAASWTK